MIPKYICINKLIIVSAQLITNKWNNIRDAFIRSLNVKSGQAARKPYVYHENLKFLLKFTQKAETDGNVVEETEQEHEVIAANDNEHSDNVAIHESKKEPSKTKRKIDSIEAAILKEIKENKTTNAERVLTEDSFFTSFIPYVKDMSEPEKIQLQMDLLSSIQKIKQNRVLHQRVRSPYILANPSPGHSRSYPNHGHSIHSNSINSPSPILLTSPSPTSNSYIDVPSPQSVVIQQTSTPSNSYMDLPTPQLVGIQQTSTTSKFCESVKESHTNNFQQFFDKYSEL